MKKLIKILFKVGWELLLIFAVGYVIYTLVGAF